MEYQIKTKSILGTVSEHFIETEFCIFQANVLWSSRWDRKPHLVTSLMIELSCISPSFPMFLVSLLARGVRQGWVKM